MGIQVQSSWDNAANHAQLAMQAARRVARARRQSQKEKMGHVVCHHLLCLLNAESELPTRRKLPAIPTLEAAREIKGEDRQISLGF